MDGFLEMVDPHDVGRSALLSALGTQFGISRRRNGKQISSDRVGVSGM